MTDTIRDVITNMDLPRGEPIGGYAPVPIPDDRIWPAELKALFDNPNAVKLQIEGPAIACINCGGAGMLFVYVWIRGPFSSPNGGKVKWLSGDGIESGWYIGETHSAPCPCCQGDAWREYLQANCGLHDKDLYITLEGFKSGGPYLEKEEAKKAAAGLLAQNKTPKGFVTFFGEPGRGKSHLLKGIINGFRGIGVYARYINAADLIQEIRDHFSDERGGVAVESVIQHYRKVRVLAIDELDQVQLTEWTKQTLHRLLDSRYESGNLLTVLAMRPTPEQLPDDLAYLISRIRGGVAVHVRGGDMRPFQGNRARKELVG